MTISFEDGQSVQLAQHRRTLRNRRQQISWLFLNVAVLLVPGFFICTFVYAGVPWHFALSQQHKKKGHGGITSDASIIKSLAGRSIPNQPSVSNGLQHSISKLALNSSYEHQDSSWQKDKHAVVELASIPRSDLEHSNARDHSISELMTNSSYAQEKGENQAGARDVAASQLETERIFLSQLASTWKKEHGDKKQPQTKSDVFSLIAEAGVFDGVIILCYGNDGCTRAARISLNNTVYVLNGQSTDAMYNFSDKRHDDHIGKASISHLHAISEASMRGWHSILILEADVVESEYMKRMDLTEKRRLVEDLRDTLSSIRWKGLKLSAYYNHVHHYCGADNVCGLCHREARWARNGSALCRTTDPFGSAPFREYLNMHKCQYKNSVAYALHRDVFAQFTEPLRDRSLWGGFDIDRFVTWVVSPFHHVLPVWALQSSKRSQEQAGEAFFQDCLGD